MNTSLRACIGAAVFMCAVSCSDELPTGGKVKADPHDVRSADPALAEAQGWLASEVGAQPGQLRASFVKPPVDLPVPCTIDIESASRAEGEIEFVRLVAGETTTHCERIVFRGPGDGRELASGRVETVSTPTAALRHLLDTIRVLPGLQVIPRDDATEGEPSSEFFRLVRIHGAEGAPDTVFEYAGRLGERGAPEFSGPRAIAARAASLMRTLRWQASAQSAWRSSHYTDAFARDRERLARPGRDWLTERCVEALAWFGAPPAAETVRWLRDKAVRMEPRILARMQVLAEDPDRFLEGPPQELPRK